MRLLQWLDQLAFWWLKTRGKLVLVDLNPTGETVVELQDEKFLVRPVDTAA